MKVSTPTISWHNRERVSSVDFQPVPHPSHKSGSNKSRLASAGDDKHVVIWELEFDDESGKIEPMCLCDINRHQNSVNVVRWSPNGHFLASGDTDSTIYIWQFDEKEAPPDIFAEEECIRKENWTMFKCLRGHLQDVIGLTWSPDANHLISCSTDSTAIVFDVKKGTKLKILSDHNGWVNGVAWDPLNKYVMTIASDRSLRAFTTNKLKYVKKINRCKLDEDKSAVRLFYDDTFMSFYRRMDFSPDGELLAVPSGILESDSGDGKVVNCTHIFSRLNFTKPVLSLPGKEFSICVRFSPIKYTLRPIPSKPQPSECENSWQKYETMFAMPYRMVYAIATQNAVTFYDTQQPEPFAQVSRIHYVGLNDLTWSANGTTLIVSSTDGFCSIVNFKAEELGEIYDENSKEPKVTSSKDGIELNDEGVSSPAQIKIRSAKEGGKPNPKRLQLITLSSPKSKEPTSPVKEKKRAQLITLN